jgi:hypothetical protein
MSAFPAIRVEFADSSHGYLRCSVEDLMKIERELRPLVCIGELTTQALSDLQTILDTELDHLHKLEQQVAAWRRRNRIRYLASQQEIAIYAAVRWGLDNPDEWLHLQQPRKLKTPAAVHLNGMNDSMYDPDRREAA